MPKGDVIKKGPVHASDMPHDIEMDANEFKEIAAKEDEKMSSGMMFAMILGIVIIIVSAIALVITFIDLDDPIFDLELGQNFLISREEAMIDNLLTEIDTELASADPSDDFIEFDDSELANATTESELDSTISEIDSILEELDTLDQDFGDVDEGDLGL